MQRSETPGVLSDPGSQARPTAIRSLNQCLNDFTGVLGKVRPRQASVRVTVLARRGRNLERAVRKRRSAVSRKVSLPVRWGAFGWAGVLALLAGHGLAQQNATFNSFWVDDGWLNLRDGRRMGLATKVALDRDGKSLWVFDRCGAVDCVGSMVDPIAKFDPLGNLMVRFGAGMFNHPHGLHVDHDGNLWATDDHGGEGKGHAVFKFSPQGKVLMTLGKAGVAGGGPDTFNAPTDVFVASNGDVFVSDGHGGATNARIVKFSKEGKFIAAWGKRGSGPGEFALPHALAMDSAGRLFVADRGNNRIEIFDQDGKFIAQWKQFWRPSGLFIDKNDILYCTDSA